MTLRRTLPELFLKAVQLDSERPFLLWRDDDRVVSLSRPDALSRVARIAAGLRGIGLVLGDRVGILAPSSPEWFLFDLASLCAGAVVVPLFSNLSPENLAWEIGDSGLKLILVQDSAQYDQVKGICPVGTGILSVMPVDGIRQMDSIAVDVPEPGAWIASEEALMVPESAATIIYTSGSTGRPKGVVLSHKALCFQVNAAQKRFPVDPAVDSALSCLPLAHVFERMVAYFHLDNHYPLAISRDVQKVGDDLKIFKPTILTVVPRLLEKMLGKIESGVRSAGSVKKWIGKAALYEARQERHVLSKLADSVLEPIAWSRIRHQLGGRLRIVVSGGAPLSPDLESCLSRMGIPIYQGYGMTELSPVIAVNFPGANKIGSVGFPMPGVDLRIAHDGEVLVRSPSALLGFWNDPGARSKVVDESGWLATGDLGRIDPQGFLFLTGRKKDLCKTAGGKYVAPVPIEDALATHPWIEYAVVAADDRKFVSALISLDNAAIRQNLALSGSLTVVTDFVASPAFHAEIERHIQKVNQGLNEWERVRRWILAGQPFRIETGELTPTLKVRRSEVLVRYQARFDSLYSRTETGSSRT